jgi:hypothetical protein
MPNLGRVLGFLSQRLDRREGNYPLVVRVGDEEQRSLGAVENW